MATKKKELLIQENIGVELSEGIGETDAGGLSAEIPATFETSEAEGETAGETALDLNELLSGMDQPSDGTAEGDTAVDSATGETCGDTLLSQSIAADIAESETTSEETVPAAPPDSKGDGSPAAEAETAKPRRVARKKQAANTSAEMEIADHEGNESASSSESPDTEDTVTTAADREPTAPRRTTRSRSTNAPVLTIDARSEVETEEEREDIIWHEIHNAYRTRRILTGELGGVEQTDTGKTIAIVDYKGFRIVIPLKEMMINLGRMPSGQEYADLMLRQNKILGNMLGAEIDFIVMGIDSKTRSVVASRKEAIFKKRQIFYLDTDTAGMYRIYEGRIVQARIIAVAEKVIRVEIFGVECSIMARDLAWDWVGDAHGRFNVGDQVLVRILSVRRDNSEDIGVKADIKSVSQNPNQENLKKCRIQSKYAGKVTDVHKGVVYVRLSNGANAVAHSCYDHRTPGKKDDVSFAVTRLDEERGVAAGIITRIIRQNL